MEEITTWLNSYLSIAAQTAKHKWLVVATRCQQNYLQAIPRDVQNLITSMLSDNSLAKLALVSKYWNLQTSAILEQRFREYCASKFKHRLWAEQKKAQQLDKRVTCRW